MRKSLLAADQPTRSALQAVLTTLQAFDHRLELVITPVHYTDLFGDNWAIVRQFVESPHGKSVPETSQALLEIIILYKRAQEARWVPINHDRIHAWWTEGHPPAEMAVGIVRVHGRSIRPGCSRASPRGRRAFAEGTSKTDCRQSRRAADARRPTPILRADEASGIGV